MPNANMDGILFSVVIPNFNNGKYIAETIKSVQLQTYKNIEIIVVDDCSTDDSLAVVKRLAEKDSRIKFFRNNLRRGVGYSKRIGVQHSRGDLIGTLGSDDALVPEALEVMAKYHRLHPDASLVYSTYFVCDKNLAVLDVYQSAGSIPRGDTYLTYKDATSGTITSFRTFKRSFYSRTGGYDPYFIKAVDKDIIYKLEEVGETVFINNPLYYYRHHENNISRNKNAWLAFLWEVRAKEKAYYRRLGASIPNITKDKLYGEYYFVYKNLASESLKDKEYGKYLRYCWQFMLKFKNPLKTLKFIYYTLKKHHNPSSFKGEKND